MRVNVKAPNKSTVSNSKIGMLRWIHMSRDGRGMTNQEMLFRVAFE